MNYYFFVSQLRTASMNTASEHGAEFAKPYVQLANYFLHLAKSSLATKSWRSGGPACWWRPRRCHPLKAARHRAADVELAPCLQSGSVAHDIVCASVCCALWCFGFRSALSSRQLAMSMHLLICHDHHMMNASRTRSHRCKEM